jgi:hypothetical protein
MTLGPKEGAMCDARFSHHVVPAKAGTHTLRHSDAEGVSNLRQQIAKS